MISALLVAINLSFAPWREHFLATNLVVYTKMMTFCLSATFLPFMFLGTLFHSLHKGAITLKTFAVASAVLWGAFMLGAFLGAWSQGDGRTVPLFYSMAWGIFALFYFRLGAWQNAVTRFLGNVSYPLYVVHGLAGYVIIAILIDKGVPAAAATGLAAAAVIAVAWMLHKAVELPTMRLASAMARHMSVEAPTRRPEAAAPEWTGAGPQLPPGTTTVVLFPRRPL
jgi:peptidoglycan/LPS O-acetylase OafA/YrhL